MYSCPTEGESAWPRQTHHWLPVPKNKTRGAPRPIPRKKQFRRFPPNLIGRMPRPDVPLPSKMRRRTKTSQFAPTSAGTSEVAPTVLPKWTGIAPKASCGRARIVKAPLTRMPQSTTIRRRAFLRNAVASAVAVPLASGQQSSGPATQAGIGANESQLPKTSSPGDLKGEMLYRPLGRTGETVSAIGLGGSHIAKPTLTEAETIRLIHAAIDRGITFMDNSWDYNEGRSERLMGKALSENHSRNKVFLMTNMHGRAKGVAAEQIDSS